MKPAKSKAAPGTELVIITGLSGSGKGTVLKALEDLGYYAVDNLPLGLLPTFAELARQAPNIHRAALVVDIREGQTIKNFPAVFAQVQEMVPTTLIYLEASDAVLQRRFSETRRPHPLGTGRTVAKSIQHERRVLKPIRELATIVVDSSKFNVHELREVIQGKLSGARDTDDIMVYVTSFGFRHGVPQDADLLFDVRFLPNPNYIPEFKPLRGLDEKVAAHMRSFPQTGEFIDRIADLLIYLLPHYIKEGKSYLTIAFGCTGGHHRSVMIAHEIYERLKAAGFAVRETHRDLNK